MDRLETFEEIRNSIARKNLHSSMDRLETKKKELQIQLEKIIYIPVWIDQKQEVGDRLSL